MKKITLILGLVLTLVIGIVMLNPIQTQIDSVSKIEKEVDVYKNNTFASYMTFSGLITNENKLYMWGGDTSGILWSDESYTQTHIPTLYEIPNNETPIQIKVSELHMGVITEEGNLYMMGENSNGRVGDGTFTDKNTLTLITIPNNETPKQLSLGNEFTGLITEEGKLYMWGDNFEGQLGDGTEVNKNTPTLINIPNNETPKQLSLGEKHAGIITEEGNLYMWGYNSDGQLGDGTEVDKNTPTLINIPNNETPKQLSLGSDFSGLITEENNLYMWGHNNGGQLGDGTLVDKNTPTLITLPNNHTLIDLQCGETSSFLLTLDNRVLYWGWNLASMLGDESTNNVISPQYHPFLDDLDIKQFVYGYQNGILITTSNEIYTWGRNLNYVRGFENTDSINYPTQLPTYSSFNDENLLVVDYTETIIVENTAPYISLLKILPLVLVAGLVVLTTMGVKKEYF
jgi:alpha-tubulin suppressor-like RCC1 family protein